ncbi:MAG: ABC transporter permease [Anaerolineaceae bacterium]|nr:ABC transporter permease [Anaerolineaceae bacterium]
MVSFIIRRIFLLFPVLLGVSFLTFSISEITPGDPVVIMLGNRATPERIENLRNELGLNDPFWVRFGSFVIKAAQGDLGKSIRGQTPVAREILDRLPSTAELALVATFISILLGIPIGIIAAQNRGGFWDNFFMFFALLGLSIPVFWLAIILIIIFGVNLKWVSVTGGEGIKDLILPAITLGLAPAATLARLTRSSMLEVLEMDYVRTARSKGLKEMVVQIKHVLRNALIPVVTYLGMLFGGLLAGAIFVESVFARPGLGRFAINAISARDFPQVQGLVLFIATFYVILNLIVDILYGVIDPRIRYT